MLGSFEVFPNHSVSHIDLAISLNSSSSGCGAKASRGLSSSVEDSATAIELEWVIFGCYTSQC